MWMRNTSNPHLKYYKVKAISCQARNSSANSGHHRSTKIIKIIHEGGCNPKALMNYHRLRVLQSPYSNGAKKTAKHPNGRKKTKKANQKELIGAQMGKA